MAGSMKYRLRIGPADSENIKRFAAAMRELQEIEDNRGYGAIAGHHGAPDGFCWHWQHLRRSDPRLQLFLPWHRAYLNKLELALQDIDEHVALPWWDWVRERDVPEAYHVRQIDGEENPLRRFRIRLSEPGLRVNRFTRRRPGSHSLARLPDEGEVESLLADSDWSSFSDRLQELHDGVHVWVGGDMASLSTAAFDPIFFAHHCMVDRIWYLWQVRHGLNSMPEYLREAVLDPFTLTAGETVDVQSLGYEYADTAMPIEPVAPEPN